MPLCFSTLPPMKDKIRACKETQRDPDFCVVARIEAFIAGYGLEEALRRRLSYESRVDVIGLFEAADVHTALQGRGLRRGWR